MRKFFKYALTLNISSIADQVAGIVFASGDNNNSDLDNGFGFIYKWWNINDAFIEAKRTRKPICLLIHRQWCPACKKLKIKFSKSMKLLDLSRNFIMVNVESTEDMVNRNKKFYPDGKYVPRIMFFNPDGELIKEAYNHSPLVDPKNRYFYNTPGPIIDTMLFVLNMDSENEILESTDYSKKPKMPQSNNEKPSFDKPTILD